MSPAPIPITVIGGYLGSGKTTLLNRLLRRAHGRRIGVVVNDFGDVGIDADLLSGAIGDTPGTDSPIVNLANGCVCCTLGDDFRSTLEGLAAIVPRLEHIVVEASGVADPSTISAWGTVPGFAPGGVVVLAACDSVVGQASDRYVGGEVRRQIVGADHVVVTKVDLCDSGEIARVVEWIGTLTEAPTIGAEQGEIGVDIVLGALRRTDRSTDDVPIDRAHDDTYVRWSTDTDVVEARLFDGFLSGLPPGILRMKGFVDIRIGSGDIVPHEVQVVGRTIALVVTPDPGPRRLEAIGIAGVLSVRSLQDHAEKYLWRS